jgi:hypothetical protein
MGSDGSARLDMQHTVLAPKTSSPSGFHYSVSSRHVSWCARHSRLVDAQASC